MATAMCPAMQRVSAAASTSNRQLYLSTCHAQPQVLLQNAPRSAFTSKASPRGFISRHPQLQSRRGSKCIAQAYNGKDRDIGDRVIAALPYLLPLLDVYPYGKYLMFQFPFIARAMAPLAPLNAFYMSFPFAPFIVFLAVYSGIVNNYNLSRFVRYNAMQAVLMDILLIIPQIILSDIFKMPSDPVGMQLYINAYNTIFLFVAVCVALGMGSALVGQTARLPLVAEAADVQVKDGPSGW